MKYDFENIVDRHALNSMKWSNPDKDSISMSIADMDFKVCPEIEEALIKAVKTQNYGYSDIPKEYFLAFRRWFSKYHNITYNTNDMIFATGVVPIISSCVRKLTTPNENVCLLTPNYNIFYNSIVNNGCRILASELIYKDGVYSIDFDDLEAKLANPQTNLFILCNPHNPIGKIWSKEELRKIGKLCLKYHVTVISDEIHCDITEPNKNYVPFLSVDESFKVNTIVCVSTTKAFSTPGTHHALAIVPNKFLFNKVNRALNTDEVAECNFVACQAAIAALNKGHDWLEEMKQKISENRKLATEILLKDAPHLKVIKADATYLMWVDCSYYTDDCDRLCKVLEREHKLTVGKGSVYGSNSKAFVRINLATNTATLKEGLRRFLIPFRLLKTN